MTFDVFEGSSAASMLVRLREWYDESEKLRNEEITQEEYDNWRYTYPDVYAKRMHDTLDELKNK